MRERLRTVVMNTVRMGMLASAALLATLATTLYAERPQVISDEATEAVELLETNVQEIFERASAATVGIGSGSGVVVSEDGLLLTVAHVAPKIGSRLSVTFANGRRTYATVLGTHKELDAAVCRLDKSGPYPFVPLRNSSRVSNGDWVVALGYPMSYAKGQPPAVRVGRVSHRHGEKTLVADCPIMGGDSGGPLLNLAGEVVGIGSRCQDDMRVNTFVAEAVYRNHWLSLVSGEDLTGLRKGRKPGRPQRPTVDNSPRQTIEIPEYPAHANSQPRQIAAFKLPAAITRQTSRHEVTEPLFAVQETLALMQVQVLADGNAVGAGCCWRDNTLVVTKASLLPVDCLDIECRFSNNSRFTAIILGIDEATDVAVLQLQEVDAHANLNDKSFASATAKPGSLAVSSRLHGELVTGFVTCLPRHFSLRQPTIDAKQPF